MTKEIQTQQKTDIISVIDKAMSNPDMDVVKIQQLLDMQERIMSKQAEIDFNNAMAKLQEEMPVIKQSASINHSGRMIAKYAKYEDIDRMIRPIYVKNGFSLSYDSVYNGNVVEYRGTVHHVSGHSQNATIVLPSDSSGSKNQVQAMGSTLTYAKRYLITMLLNIITTNEDDDGASVQGKIIPITSDQEKKIEDLMKKNDVPNKQVVDYFNVKAISAMTLDQAREAIVLLSNIRKGE